MYVLSARAYTRGVGVKTLHLSLIFHKNLIIFAKEINFFAYILLVDLST